jgi:hypothetical protein
MPLWAGRTPVDSYNPSFDNELKKANENMTRCLKVEASVLSPGWQEVIEPLIDKTISDITGGKVNGKWHGGLLDKARKDERREYYIGYKQAMIDFHGRVMAYVAGIKQLHDRIESLKKQKEPRYKVPMVDDTRYNNAV